MTKHKQGGASERLVAWAVGLTRPAKRLIMLTADGIMIPLALATAIWLKQGGVMTGLGTSPWLYIAAVGVSIPIFGRLGLYRAVVRFLGARASKAIFTGVTASVLCVWLVNDLLLTQPLPGTAIAIYWALALLYVGGSRLLARQLLVQRPREAERVAIFGAGEAGARLASSLHSGRDFLPVAFVDDNDSLWGGVIHGVEVYAPKQLPDLIKIYDIRRVLLAVPSANHRRRREILATLEPLGLHVQTVPDIGDIVVGHARVEDIRDVDASDLLGREPVAPDARLFDACIRNKVVMVTGAGGSIGAELVRQIARLGPRRILLLEMSELALYNIDRELRHIVSAERLEFEVTALLGNAHHKYRMREIIQAYGVQTLYHAAAYKHVPIVEENIIEGIHNNVISTWYTAEAAHECGVETFVLISTDKAVNPTNVMGATKRLAEIVLQGLQKRGSRTRFCMVRFGNVLESSGSVVPLFREQIHRGGPVTVTHPDVIRYFMTIPEASQLVLQAGAMASGGDLFVLDMGKPVRIVELARRMISLSGLTVRDDASPDGDIEIRFTGLRPAEKLFEELLIGNNVAGTEHPMIMRAFEHSPEWPEVQELLQQLIVAMGQFDVREARDVLMRGVREYRPSGDISDLVWRWSETHRAAEGKVTNLQTRRAGVKTP
ncbi:MAG: polysaccharide biosynthesis protein [Steroidobacteraceae bacterium]|nr:polysaccharide biosynthesis protein [Steroidobacteraceae bacterium]